jgi:hypothetical protein
MGTYQMNQPMDAAQAADVAARQVELTALLRETQAALQAV